MNPAQVSLIEDPPPKCPYFTLPDTGFFITPEDIKREEESRPHYVSLIDLFGAFEKMSDDNQAKFLLSLLQHSVFAPDYDAMAQALNLANGHHVRRRFVAIADKQGFEVGQDDKVQAQQGDIPESSEARKKKAKSKISRKRKSTTTTKGSSKDKEPATSDAETTPPYANSTAAEDSETNIGYSFAEDAADVEDNLDSSSGFANIQ